MELVFYPRSFNIQPGKVAAPEGERDVVSVIIQDVSGNTCRVIFGGSDWEGFQQFVADPAGAGERAKARALLLGPDGRAPTLKTRKH